MSWRRGFVLGGIATLLMTTACGGESGPVAAPRDLAVMTSQMTFEPGCPRWRWIGVHTWEASTCPQISSWNTYSVFNHTECGDADCTQGLPPGLARFCRFEHTTLPTQADIDVLINHPELEAVAPDCFHIAPMAEPVLTSLTWQHYRDVFHVNVGKTRLALAPTEVRLAILDSASDKNPPAAGDSKHGYALLRMAEELTCGEEGGTGFCLAEVTVRSVLRFQEVDMEHAIAPKPPGGFVGTPGDLAEAIDLEIDDWRPHEIPHLVINLSVGMNRYLTPEVDEAADMVPGVQALYRSLQRAHCKGALIVAAAGNRSDGPVLPGYWESHRAPSVSFCEEQLGVHPPPMGDYPTLLVAAGGVQANGAHLSTSAVGGQPRLVAYADHAVEGTPAGPTGVLTGTSVSALVVSALFANAWSYRHDLTPDALVEAVWSEGVPTGQGPADFCSTDYLGGCPEVRRVSLCSVLQELCRTPVGACPVVGQSRDLLPCEHITPAGFDLPRFLVKDPLTCSPETPCVKTGPGLELAPWLIPQPPSGTCSTCPAIRLDAWTKLIIDLNPAFKGTLSAPVLTINGDKIALELPSVKEPTEYLLDYKVNPGDKITLSFTVDGQYVVTDPIYVK